MQPRFFTFLLLALIGFGLIRGPHPCRAEAPESVPVPAQQEVKASCHGHGAHHAEAPSSEEPGSDQTSRDERICEKACQRTAILAVRLPLVQESPVSWTVAVAPVRLLPLVTEPIDHVPLA